MAKDVKNCQACEDLTEYAPEFVANGVTSTICTSLKNNTGFNPALSNQHENCEDLDDANDCLIGNMVDEVERFDVCDWKAYARLFAANIYNVLKAIICSMCGIWNNIKSIKKSITNIWNAINELVNRVDDMGDDVDCLETKVGLITFLPVVRAFRNGGTSSASVSYSSLVAGEDVGTLRVYMDASDSDAANLSPNGTYGSTPADRDYIAFVTWCADGQHLGGEQTSVQISVRNNSQSQAYGTERAQHYSVKGDTHLSINQTGFCYLPKGGHLLIRVHCGQSDGAEASFRVHQFSMVLMPVVNSSDVQC